MPMTPMTLMPTPMPTLTLTIHNGQSMIVYGSLVDKPNEPENLMKTNTTLSCVNVLGTAFLTCL